MQDIDDSTKARTVIVARHGERLDYVTRDQGGNWVATAVSRRPFDTPLTEHGQAQARRLGHQLVYETQRLGLPPISHIYSSPFLRCLQTSAYLRQGALEATAKESFKTPYDQYDSEHGEAKTSTMMTPTIPLVKVEIGLAESINENWYRSWSIPGANGTWGYCPPGLTKKQHKVEIATLHPLAKQAVQPLLDWKAALSDSAEDVLVSQIDLLYASQTTIDTPYTFDPLKTLLESRTDQQKRMAKVLDAVTQPGQTIVLVSHGGPVTHLYEALTGNPWYVHGDSTYCCYSIYQRNEAVRMAGGESVAQNWIPLVVNESKYLHESLVSEQHVD